jgi:hypothetical protein
MVLDSLTFLVAVPVDEKTVRPMHCNDGHEHHACDTEGGDAREQSDRKTERTLEFCGDRQQREDCGNTRVREVLHRPLEAVAAEPPERFLSTVRKDHYRESDPQKQSRYAAVSLQQPINCVHRCFPAFKFITNGTHRATVSLKLIETITFLAMVVPASINQTGIVPDLSTLHFVPR